MFEETRSTVNRDR